MAVTTRWTPLTTTPIIGSTTYPEDIDTRNTEMASRMEEIDDMGQEMNGVADEVEANGNTVASNLVQSNSDKADAEAASAEAVAAAEAIKSYVIPEEATYSYSEADTITNQTIKLSSVAYGYTKRVKKSERWLETDTPNVIVDKLGDDVRFLDGLYSRNTELDNHTATSTDASSSIYQTDDTSMFSVDDAVQIVNYETSDVETSGIITAISTDVSITLGDADTYNRVSGTKYIAKELPQAELPDAPFASGSTDELLDDAVNGVETQSDHSVGDLIVTGNQLITNGTFDTDVSGWTPINNAVLTINSNRLSIEPNTTDYPRAEQAISVVDGATYNVSFEGSGTTFSVEAWTGINRTGSRILNVNPGSKGSYTYQAQGTTNYIVITSLTTVDSGVYTYIDNISVTLKDTIYQNIADSTAGDDLTLTEKFQVLTRVTTHDILRDTKTGYDAARGLNLFAAGVSNDTIASATNYSKLGNGLYHDGTQEVTIPALRTTLNGGAYHPFYNSKGCRQFSDNENWDATTDTVLSIYDCFANRSSSTTSGRPEDDGKVENIVYYNQLLFKPTYSQQANEHDLLAEPIDLDMAEYMTLGTEQFLQTTTGTVATIEVADGTLYKIFNYINIYDLTATTLKGRYLIESIDGDELTLTTTLSKSANQYLISGLQSPYSLTQGDKLDAVATGDPQYWSPDWLSYIAGGNTVDVIMNTNSVNGGASLLPNGTTDDFLMPSKILSASTSGDLIYDNSAGTWGAGTTNIVTNAANIITSTNLPADDVSLSSYTSQNNPVHFNDLTDYEMIIESDYVFASNTDDVLTDIAAMINAITGGISVGTDDTEKLSITKVIAGIITHTAETLTEDALVSFTLFNNTITKEYAIGCYFATDGVIDKADGAYIMNTGVFK